MNLPAADVEFPFPMPEIGEEAEKEAPQEPAKPEQSSAGEPSAKELEPAKPDEAEIKAQNLQKALHESRQHAKEAKEEAERIRQEMETREQRMAEYVRQKLDQAQPKTQEPAPPDEKEDPIGYVKWQNDKLQQRLDNLTKEKEETQRTNQQTDQIAQIQQNIQYEEQAFMRGHPDYADAVRHVQDHAAMIFEMQGFKPNEIPHQIQQWGLQFGAMQLNQRQNPAEKFYALAEKLGYKAPAETTITETDKEAKPDPILDSIEKGQKQQGLGTGSGDISTDEMTPNDDFPLLTQAMRELGLK